RSSGGGPGRRPRRPPRRNARSARWRFRYAPSAARTARVPCERSILAREPVEVFLPLDRQQRLLARVAVLACAHHVAAHGGAAAAERYQMVHRQRPGPDAATAVVADAVRDAALPPRAGPQLARLGPLAPQLVGIGGSVELSHGSSAPWRAPPTRASTPTAAARPRCARA